jgi:aspartate aminotransferase
MPTKLAVIKLSKRAAGIQPSPTLAITAKAKKLKEEGKDVVGFGAGEPDFDTPQHIKDAAVAALAAGFTKYTPSAGTADLRAAIAEKLKADNGIDVTPAQVVVSNGAKHSIQNALYALLNDGDEVIIPSPYWVSYPEMVKLAGGVPVIIDTLEEDQFRLNPKVLERLCSPKAKLLILCSPSNPTGAMYHEKDLRALLDVVVKKDLLVLSDEIYEKLTYGGAKHVSFASLSPEALQRTITINGFSKAYSMTGWRLGYAAGPLEVMKAIDNLQSHAASNSVSFAQKGGTAAVKGPQDAVEAMRAEFQKRRDVMIHALSGIPGVSCIVPEGAFYAFPNISAYFDMQLNGRAIKNSTDFAALLLDEDLVAVVPGADFGAPDYIRLSYATDMGSIVKGLERITAFCAKLKPLEREPEPALAAG